MALREPAGGRQARLHGAGERGADALEHAARLLPQGEGVPAPRRFFGQHGAVQRLNAREGRVHAPRGGL
ncbi:MAG: hypothetical protein LBB48_07280 [Treponema sp.]|nr:hypothetical protein [Treponema sp.]